MFHDFAQFDLQLQQNRSVAVLQEEAATISQQREQLVLAEKLFGMDITGYPDLVQVCMITPLAALLLHCCAPLHLPINRITTMMIVGCSAG